MQWTEAADARLFAHVLRIHNIKCDYVALAEAMGDGVTPKAITHRIANIKSRAAAPLDGADGPATPASSAKTTKVKGSGKGSDKVSAKGSKATNGDVADAIDGTPTKKGTKRAANGAAKKANLVDQLADGDDDEPKLESLQPGKRVKVEDGKIKVDEDFDEEQ